MPAPAENEILFRKDGSLAFITFNRPHARNALTWQMYDGLSEFCDRVDADAAVRVLILTGAGEQAFVAGTDIEQFRSFHTPQDATGYEQRIERVIDRLERVGKPTIAMIRGACVGAGLAIAAACDFRICAPDLRLGAPIARTLGNCLSMNNYARVLDLAGPARAKELIMLARLLSADEALRLGLVTEVVPADQLESRVRELAGELTQLAPLTLRTTKEAIRRLQARRRLESGEGDDLIETCYMSDDFRGAVQAFLEKRPYVWIGR
ncbi:MAG TPA: enoyl-CoA hydratase/isomerase family protein [bacterium]|nr:enoyl-CoA hydratase/isomerase family protein [bacterium]